MTEIQRPPRCGKCGGAGSIRLASAGRPVRDELCDECEGTGCPPPFWYAELLWFRTRVESRENLPEVVVLCGSTRFKDAFFDEGKRLAFEGKIVLTVTDLDPRPEMRNVNVPIDAGIKERLDLLHRHKIVLANRVHVLNVGGYIGESTAGEIAFAETLGRPITYLEEPR